MKHKKRLILFGILGLALLGGTGVLSFWLGKRVQKTETAGQEEEKGEGQAAFGSSSVMVTPFLDKIPCDFSFETASAGICPLADRLLLELKKQEGVEEAAAFYRRNTGNVCHGMDSLPAGNVLGVEGGFLSASGFQVEFGRGITERDVEEERRVALLDGRASQVLFHGSDPVGETIEVEGRLYQVVGVIGLSEPQTGGGVVLVPESTWPEIYQYEEPKSVVLRISELSSGQVSEEEWKQARQEAGVCAARILNSMLPDTEMIRYQILE